LVEGSKSDSGLIVNPADVPEPGGDPPQPSAVRQAVRARLPHVRLPSLLIAAAFVIAAIVPLFSSSVIESVAATVALSTVGAVALNLLQGMAGLVSVGNAAFMAIGGLTAATFATEIKLPFLLGLLIAFAVGALVGAIVSLPSIRVRGLYFLVATLPLHYIVIYLGTLYEDRLTNGAGFIMPIAEVAGYQIASLNQWYVIWVIFAALCLLGAAYIRRSSLGRAWMAMRESPDLASSFGAGQFRYSLIAFVITSGVIALQGALFAYYIGGVDMGTFTIDLAVQYVAMIIIGGEGSAIGSLLGAVVVISLPYALQPPLNWIATATGAGPSFTNQVFSIESGLYGLVILLFVLFAPRGLSAAIGRMYEWCATRVAGYRRRAEVSAGLAERRS
jgi:branched-chain amino acid transport system permease protein